MAKPEWGTKRQCPECGTRFYDLNRQPITCVKCGTSFEPEPLLKPRRQKEAEPKKPEEVIEKIVEEPEALVVEEDALVEDVVADDAVVADIDDDADIVLVENDIDGEVAP